MVDALVRLSGDDGQVGEVDPAIDGGVGNQPAQVCRDQVKLRGDEADLVQQPDRVVGGGLHRGRNRLLQQSRVGERGEQRLGRRRDVRYRERVHQVAGAVGGQGQGAGDGRDHLLLGQVLDEWLQHQIRARIERRAGGGCAEWA